MEVFINFAPATFAIYSIVHGGGLLYCRLPKHLKYQKMLAGKQFINIKNKSQPFVAAVF